jgi:uncharacterized lipoprotein NlpE involved in copper resistance
MKKKVLTAIAVIFMTFLGCSKESIESIYQYEVSGSAGNYGITCEGAPSGTVQYSDVGSGWTYKWTQTGTRWLYMSAQNNTNSGSVTVKIIRDGKVVAQQTSSGAYVIATVDGTY